MCLTDLMGHSFIDHNLIRNIEFVPFLSFEKYQFQFEMILTPNVRRFFVEPNVILHKIDRSIEMRGIE